MRKKIQSAYGLIIMFLLFASSSRAQFYFGISGNYGFPILKHVISSDYFVNSDGYAISQFKGSLGKGSSAELFSGYQLTKHCALEMRFGNLFGAQQRSSYTDDYDVYTTSTLERRIKSKISNLSAAVRFTAGEGNFKAYMRTGVLMGFGGEMVLGKKYISSGGSISESSWKYSGRIAPGVSSAIGASYKLGNFNLFFESAIICQTWAPAKAVLIKSNINGVDQLQNLTVSAKEYEFTDDNILSVSNVNDKPSQRVKQYYSFCSNGINIGVIYAMEKKIK